MEENTVNAWNYIHIYNQSFNFSLLIKLTTLKATQKKKKSYIPFDHNSHSTAPVIEFVLKIQRGLRIFSFVYMFEKWGSCVFLVKIWREIHFQFQGQTFWNKPMLCYEHNKTLLYTKTFHNMIHIFVAFLVVSTSLAPVLSLQSVPDSGHRQLQNCTLNPRKDIQKLRRVQAYLKKINKPAVKTIQACSLKLCANYMIIIWCLVLGLQSPDGDVIDCVPSHLQPAFDHPQLKGQKPLVEKQKFCLFLMH